MIVVDTNLIAYLYIPGNKSSQARHALRRDPEWIAPRLWRTELRNVAIRYVRAGYMDLNDAHEVILNAERLMLGGEFDVESRDVLDLAHVSKRSAYDCEYIALARKLKLKLVTSDVPLATSFPADAIKLDVFAAGGP